MLTTSSNTAEKVLARCQTLARFSEDREGTRRTFLSAPMRDCHREVSHWLASLGVSARVDAAGNLRGIYPGATPEAPLLLIGSHLDTVPNAGAYDGILGVTLAVALLEALKGRRLPFAIEVVGLSEEEGVRFGRPFIGSRALVGRLDDDLLACRDAQGISVRRAIEDFGLQLAEIPRARLGTDVLGYLEFHIEQGPVLENLGFALGAVEKIAGQSRLEFTFAGRANHAGTTPMHLRHDALAGAAEWIVTVENAAEVIAATSKGLVATVGVLDVRPGAVNCIAGQARVSLDVRHASDEVRESAVKDLVQRAQEIAQRRELRVSSEMLLDQRAVAMDGFLVRQIADAMCQVGCEPHRMVSGAGHDAMILAEQVPAAMIFLRTPGGVSHDPSETVRPGDIAKAIACGMQLLQQLAASREFLTRVGRA
jgi:allantoate deiminase